VSLLQVEDSSSPKLGNGPVLRSKSRRNRTWWWWWWCAGSSSTAGLAVRPARLKLQTLLPWNSTCACGVCQSALGSICLIQLGSVSSAETIFRRPRASWADHRTGSTHFGHGRAPLPLLDTIMTSRAVMFCVGAGAGAGAGARARGGGGGVRASIMNRHVASAFMLARGHLQARQCLSLLARPGRAAQGRLANSNSVVRVPGSSSSSSSQQPPLRSCPGLVVARSGHAGIAGATGETVPSRIVSIMATAKTGRISDSWRPMGLLQGGSRSTSVKAGCSQRHFSCTSRSLREKEEKSPSKKGYVRPTRTLPPCHS
jgi:hypothetical protein